jgi:hypothetical protein
MTQRVLAAMAGATACVRTDPDLVLGSAQTGHHRVSSCRHAANTDWTNTLPHVKPFSIEDAVRSQRERLWAGVSLPIVLTSCRMLRGKLCRRNSRTRPRLHHTASVQRTSGDSRPALPESRADLSGITVAPL